MKGPMGMRYVLGVGCLVACSACTAGSGGGGLHDLPPNVIAPFDGGSPVSHDASADAAASTDADASDDGNPVSDGASMESDGDATDASPTDATDAPSDAPFEASVTPPTDASMAHPGCNPRATWSAASAVPGLSFATHPIVTLTSDELTAAWVLDAGNGSGQVFASDRASATDAFGVAISVQATGGFFAAGGEGGTPEGDAGAAYFAFERVALSSDGLTLIGVSIDGQTMAAFTRAARGQAFFGAPQPSQLAAISLQLNPGERLGDPVLSADGDDLVYSRYGDSFTLSVFEAFRSGSIPFGGGSPRQGDGLQMAGTARMRPTSMSADRLTLFVWDEATSAAEGVFRSGNMTDFSGPQPYGTRDSLQVNAACSTLYYVAPVASAFGLFQVTAL